ncbi:MAG: hypothetical protein Q4C01_01725 [Clostridia bacterium]|nr:hypothetical protein [Clostridia bacterium]
MKLVINISLIIVTMSVAVGILGKLLPDGGISNTAKVCLGFVHLAAIVSNIAVLINDWGV